MCRSAHLWRLWSNLDDACSSWGLAVLVRDIKRTQQDHDVKHTYCTIRTVGIVLVPGTTNSTILYGVYLYLDIRLAE
ncbi:uncharacterized protein YALI1_B18921g [Yarrowia lipolytica]|uniref:Uncharacterized protein n=1 Tax=Yarrowia lipolytica TaxID=4952 RepID=A0A1D8N7S0_YARLL|nr:hypothetical protein YALI1_B18921g [Yarrowia lipolytica]